MKNFAEYLSEYVAKRRLSWRKAAQLCQIDRTLLGRYASGKRLPESMEKAVRIGKGLKMAPQQIEELKAAYQVSKMGEYQHRALEAIGQLFAGKISLGMQEDPGEQAKVQVGMQEDPGEWPEVQVEMQEDPGGRPEVQVEMQEDPGEQPGGQPEKPEVRLGKSLEILQAAPTQRLYGEEDICRAISQLARESPYLQVQMDVAAEGSLLPRILLSTDKRCRIEHIISLRHGEKQEAEIAAFHAILPVLCSGREYQVYCSYQWHRERGSCGRKMEMVLGSQGMVLFTADFGSGIYARQEGYQAYYQGVFQKQRKECKRYGESGRGAEELFRRLEKKGCRFQSLQHPDSGISFFHQDLFGEQVFVRKEGETQWCFYIEEPELMRMFVKFMGHP